MQICLGKYAQDKAQDTAPHFSPTGTGGGEESGAAGICAKAAVGYNQAEAPCNGGRTMAYATVADLTVDQFKALMREVVIQTLSEVLGDPDEGLELRDDIKVKMQQSLAAVKAGAKIIPAEEVAARLGLTW
jgi:hypothetical protein